MMLQRSDLLVRSGFLHGFTTRIGGVSVAPFDAADFALLRDAGALEENQARLARELGFDAARLFQAQQVHGAAVFLPTKSDPALGAFRTVGARYPEADALVATERGDTVGVRVADCVPVLVGDTRSGHVAAIHAGWKGIVAEVVAHALAALGAKDGGELVAAIGPCIGPCCFEVSREVADRIAAASTPDCVVSMHEPAKAMVDLRSAVAAQLLGLGVTEAHVEQVGGCTRCDRSTYYSFRRDGDDAGRLLGVITAR
jgi:YfiH family protein